MRLRTRLAVLFLVLLIVPICAMAIIALDYSVGTMIDDLCRSADLLAQQIFDEMQLDMANGAQDPVAALAQSSSLRKMLDSAQAFGQGVVSASIIGTDGRVIVGAQGESEGAPAAELRPIETLRSRASGWLLFTTIPQFWNANVYELRHPVLANGRPFASISVGVTTVLIADRVRRLVLVVLATALADTLIAWIVLSLITNRIVNQLARITHGFEELAQGGNQLEIKLDGHEELSALTEKFNELSRRVRTERAQLASRDHLFDIVRSMQDVIILLDAAGSILFANPRAKELLAAGSAEVDGQPLKTLLGENHRLVTLVASTMETGAEAHDVTLDFSKGASFLVTFFKLGRGRMPAGLLLLMRDLQPVIELETALDYSNRLARLGALISGVAHQLRSPLHGMNLRLELLRNDGEEGKSRHIDRLRQEVDRLDHAVEALLRFLRPEDLKISDFDINQLLRELGDRVANDGISVEYRLSDSLPLVHGDSSMLAEALGNVITNGVQAMPHGGLLVLQSARTDGGVEVAVTDTGIGIEQDKLDQIFNLYYTTKPRGNGLGLPLALRAIELNRGMIKIESEVAKGTTCKIKLPAVSTAVAQPKAVPSHGA
jgi:signal transduction histidine kinase